MHRPTRTGVLIYGLVTFAAAIVIFIALVLLARARIGPVNDQPLESFDTLSTILDERCRLNQNVSLDTGLGMVRHPTDSHTGCCVLRGSIPGNGVCDSTNTKLFDPKFVTSVAQELVDGRQQCVLRVHPGLSDHDARAYGHTLFEHNVEESDAYKSINNDRIKCVSDSAILSSDIVISHAETAVANSNWHDQVISDATALKVALQLQRDNDALVLTAAVKQRSDEEAKAAGIAIEQARVEERGKGVVMVRQEQERQGIVLREEMNRSVKAVQAAVEGNSRSLSEQQGKGTQGLKEANDLCTLSLETQAKDAEIELKGLLLQTDEEARSHAAPLAKAKDEILAFANVQAEFHEQTQSLTDLRGQQQSREKEASDAHGQWQAQTQAANDAQARASAQEQATNDARGKENMLKTTLDHTRSQIDAEKGKWMIIDGNLSGNDYAHVDGTTVTGCQARCQRDAQCTHYSWQTSGKCWLKQGKAIQQDTGYWSALSVGKYNH